MRLTAAKSSQLTTKTGKRRPRPPEAPLLPSDKAYLKSAEEEKKAREDRTRDRHEKLQIVPGPVTLDWWSDNLNRKPHLLVAMDAILDIMWKDIDRESLGGKRSAEVHYYRKSLPNLVMGTHLHSIFLNDSTHVEREIRRHCQAHKIRRFLVNHVEGGELVIKCKDYYGELESRTENKQTFMKFKELLEEMPEATAISIHDLRDKELEKDKNLLLNAGFLTLQPGQFDTYNISVPNLGSYLGLVGSCRKWVLKTLQKAPWKEMLETMLKERLESYKSHWKDYRGATIEWVLCDCYGGGWCEPFKTPVGRGWRVTGKTT